MDRKERSMNNQQSLEFVRNYFDELFGKRNVNALDLYLDKDYFDDDIGDPGIDHVKSSKEYLTGLFQRRPTIGVDVTGAMARKNVISAYLEWFVIEGNKKRIIRKGVANFVIKDQKILKRHTFVYYDED